MCVWSGGRAEYKYMNEGTILVKNNSLNFILNSKCPKYLFCLFGF